MHQLMQYGHTNIHPLGLIALIICISIIIFGDKKNIPFVLLFIIFALPSAQRIVLLGIDFSFIRIIIIIAIVVMAFGSQSLFQSYCKTDVLMLIWIAWSIVAYSVLNDSLSAGLTRIGYGIDSAGAYYVGRRYIRTWSDFRKIIIFAGYFSIPVFLLFMIERETGRNLFSVFGGVPEFTLIRDGRLRCQGAFSHPIMAGIFWSTILSWLLVVWHQNEYNKKAIFVMLVSAGIIIINAASSTPIMFVLIMFSCLVFYPLRRYVFIVRWLVIFGLILWQIVSEKGVAHILARVNIFSGSTGWHRYHLIDQAINHFNEWWLLGVTTTSHWGTGLEDVTNQYILEGVRSGTIGLVLFVLVQMLFFKRVSKMMKENSGTNSEFIYWAAGSAMLANVLTFLSVSYFGQMVAAYYMFFGAVVSILHVGLGNDNDRNSA